MHAWAKIGIEIAKIGIEIVKIEIGFAKMTDKISKYDKNTGGNKDIIRPTNSRLVYMNILT